MKKYIAIAAVTAAFAAPAFAQDRQAVNDLALEVCFSVTGAMEGAINANLPRSTTERIAEMQLSEAPDFLRSIISQSFDIAYDESIPPRERVTLVLENCIDGFTAIIEARLGTGA